MGLIKAFSGAISGTFADTWLDFLTPASGIPATVIISPAVKKSTDNGRGSNTKGSENVLTNGSKILVPDNYAIVIVENGAVVDIVAEPGGYEFSSENTQSQSVMSGGGIGSLFSQAGDRFKAGGMAMTQQLVFYVNLKEIPNNKFGTQSEIYWDDAYMNAQVGAMCRGTYSLKVTNPELFVKNFVPLTYLTADAESYDMADMDNDSANQLFNEVVGSLAPAFSIYTNDPSKGNRITKIQSDSIGFAASLSQAVEEAYSWKSDRGLEIVKVAIQAMEYDEDTKALLKDVKAADALMGARGNSFMQQSVARGMQAAGSNEGGAMSGFVGMGMGMNAGGMMMGSLQQPVAQQPVAQAAPAAAPAEDPMAKLQKMKTMLDAGLISEADYEAAKAEVLANL